MLWRIVVNVIPLGLRANEDVRGYFFVERSIDSAYTKANSVGGALSAPDDWGTTVATKHPMYSSIVAIAPKRLATPGNAEVLGCDGGNGDEWPTASLPAARAMAIDYWAETASNFVLDCATEATTFMHVILRRGNGGKQLFASLCGSQTQNISK